MNKKCKYCLTATTCPSVCEENSIYCAIHRRIPKNVDKTFAQLQEENKKYKEVIDKAIKYCQQEISAASNQYERNNKQQDLIYKVAHERILDILKEVE